jgi:glutathione synthase/RimK-type ligase-like ATP-grasp enzyme
MNVVFSNKVVNLDCFSEQEFKLVPVIAQQWIDKAYDLRVTVVGDKIFAVKIDSQISPETEIDWRAGHSIIPPHSPYVLPQTIFKSCLSLTKHLNLSFGAIDLVRDKQGNYWFLEINPNGQWAWLETQTGLPISDCIAALLKGK